MARLDSSLTARPCRGSPGGGLGSDSVEAGRGGRCCYAPRGSEGHAGGAGTWQRLPVGTCSEVALAGTQSAGPTTATCWADTSPSAGRAVCEAWSRPQSPPCLTAVAPPCKAPTTSSTREPACEGHAGGAGTWQRLPVGTCSEVAVFKNT